MQYNLNNKRFRSISNEAHGDVGDKTLFHYYQKEDLVWATYSGGTIRQGNIIGRWQDSGKLEIRYQHVSTDNEFKTGKCLSTPELIDGKLRLHEQWQWTSGDQAKGTSIIEEI